MAAVPTRSITTAAKSGLFSVLKNQCGISQAFDPRGDESPPVIREFEAIWDTGATNSVITQTVIDACGLVATGMAQVHGVHGVAQSETYLVNIALPNKVIFGVSALPRAPSKALTSSSVWILLAKAISL